MKIFIGGKIGGMPDGQARQRFDDVEALLDCIGFDAVNPLKEIAPCSGTWKQRLAAEIALLLECDAIYLFDNWREDVGSVIEHGIASRLEMDVWFESGLRYGNSEVAMVQNAIHDVMGMRFNEYTTKSRKRDYVYARMIFIYHCRKFGDMALSEISRYLNRDHSSILYLYRKYDDEVKYNASFRETAKRVDAILKKNGEPQEPPKPKAEANPEKDGNIK